MIIMEPRLHSHFIILHHSNYIYGNNHGANPNNEVSWDFIQVLSKLLQERNQNLKVKEEEGSREITKTKQIQVKGNKKK